MPISQTQILEKLKERTKKNKIRDASVQQEHLRFHTENILQTYVPQQFGKFENWVRGILTKEKMRIFKSLVKFPLETCKLTDEVYRSLSKIFEGTDPNYSIEFVADDVFYESDALMYLKKCGYKDKFRKKLFEIMKHNINSIVVLATPEEQEDDYPEPYWDIIDINAILDYEEDNTGGFDYVIYSKGNDKICVLDDESYRIFTYKDDALTFEAQAENVLGYTPAKWFWSEQICGTSTALSPLSLYLSTLDDLLFKKINLKYAELYAAYPVYWGYRSECSYEDEEGRFCEEGYLKDRATDQYLVLGRGAEYSMHPCPKCNSRLGVGSYIEVPFPDENTPKVGNPVGKLDADTKSIELLRDGVKMIETEVYQGITGNLYSLSDKDASFSDSQIMTFYEGAQLTLLSLQKNFEEIENWLVSGLLTLRYGDVFDSYHVSYGSSHYIYTPQLLLKEYCEGLEKKLPDNILNMLQDKYIEAKFRNNPKELMRAKMLIDLEPYRHLSKEQVSEMRENGLISNEDYMLKMNFGSILAMWERNNIRVEDFGYASSLSYDQKISRISESLKNLVQVNVTTTN